VAAHRLAVVVFFSIYLFLACDENHNFSDPYTLNVEIISPTDHSLHLSTISIELNAYDSSGTFVSPIDSMVWVSNLDGLIFRWDGYIHAGGIPVSSGHHVLTATVYKDSLIGVNEIEIDVVDSMIVRVVYQDSSWAIFQTPSIYPYCMASDRNEQVYIGTLGGGLIHFNNFHWKFYTTQNSPLEENTIQSLAIAPNQTLDIGYWLLPGIMTFNGATWWKIPFPDSLASYRGHDVHSITYDRSNRLWAALHDGKIIHYSAGWNVVNPSMEFPHPGRISFDSRGRLWGNSEHGGAFSMKDSVWTLYSCSEFGAGCSYVLAIDHMDYVWFGSWGYGLFRYDGNSWIGFDSSNSNLPSNFINALAIDAQNQLWVGTNDGLAVFNGSIWKIYNSANSPLPSDYIGSLTVSSTGKIWIGTPSHISVLTTFH
jgi:ligand-binding sensor domain-containing protein